MQHDESMTVKTAKTVPRAGRHHDRLSANQCPWLLFDVLMRLTTVTNPVVIMDAAAAGAVCLMSGVCCQLLTIVVWIWKLPMHILGSPDPARCNRMEVVEEGSMPGSGVY